MRAGALRESRMFGLATLGLMVALGPAAVHAEPAAGRILQRIHDVKPGETLTSLAKRYGVTVAIIVKANRLPSNARLISGQRLVIPFPEGRGACCGPASPARAAASAPTRPPTRLVLAVPDFDIGAVPFAWPVEGPVISTFGQRRSGWHGGIDIKAPLGTPVWAAASGVVIASGPEADYGLVVKIEHRRGFVTVYAHNDVNLVEVGDRVDAGEMIALVGQTGRATTHHVHFEIRHEGQAYNPLYLLPLPPRIAQIDETAERPHE